MGVSVPLRVTANPGRQKIDSKSSPTTGRVTRVILQVPRGCQNLVDSRVLVNGELLVPSDGTFVRGDGIVWDLPTMKEARIGDVFTLWVGNRDDTYPHSIEANVQVEEGPVPYREHLLHTTEQVRAPQDVPGARSVLSTLEAPQPVAPRAQPPPPVQPRAAEPPSAPVGGEAFQLAQQAIQFLGIVAVGLVVAIIVMSMGRRDRA